MNKIIAILLVLLAFNANAKEITVTAYGEGDDYDWAVMNAVENAVRQTSEISVQSNGMHKLDVSATLQHDTNFEGEATVSDNLNVDYTERDGIIPTTEQLNADAQEKATLKTKGNETYTASVKDNSKDILAKYSGTVSSYEVLEHSQENGKHRVKIKATIFKYDTRDYKSKSLVKKADYSLAIMPFKMSGNIKCLGQKVDAKAINTIISNLFIEKLAPSRKFNLVDRNNLDDYAAEMSIIENDLTSPENKIKLKNLAAADYILVGTIDNFVASTSKSYIEMTGETNYSSSSKLKLSYRILEAATMEIVSAGSVEKTFSKEGAFSSCANVEQLLFEKAISEAAETMLTDIFPDYKPSTKPTKKKSGKRKVQSSRPEPAPDYSLPMY